MQPLCAAAVAQTAAAQVWALDHSGLVHIRSGVTKSNPLGKSWERIEGTAMLSCITVGLDAVWGIDLTGKPIYRTAVSHALPQGVSWLPILGALTEISVGPTGHVWGVDEVSRACELGAV